MNLVEFFQTDNLSQAKEYIFNHEKTKILAGGTDLVLAIRRNEIEVEHIVDLTKINELKTISENKDSVIMGSTVTFTDILESKIIKDNFNSLIQCSETMGSLQIRNTATIGGNIINAGSAADFIPCIMSLDGILVIESMDSIREISCEDYFKNYKTEKISSNEILTKVIIPKVNSLKGYYKLGKRNSLAIARLNAAVNIELRDEVISKANVALGAVGKYAFRVHQLEEKAINKPIEWLYSDEALECLETTVEESIKGRKTMPFKKEAIKGVYKQALQGAVSN